MRYCQFNEEELLNPILPKTGFFVEIGCLKDHKFSNTRHLVDKGWEGIWVDKDAHEDVRQMLVTADNINELLPYSDEEIDFLSLDIDGNDYWVFKAMRVRPRVVMVEFNPNMPYGVMARNDAYEWKGGNEWGASRAAMIALAEEKGYTLYAENQTNLVLCLSK